jgi:Flp pilus assembly protein TadG
MTKTVRSHRRPHRRGDTHRDGQALVEFALAVIPFLILLMGVVDLGRGIYTMNGTSEAARDIARATIVHLTNTSGTVGMSDETAQVIATQKGLVPGLTINPATDIQCVDAYDVVQNKSLGNGNDCTVGVDFIRVRVTAPFSPITPLVSAFGSHTFDSTSRMTIP